MWVFLAICSALCLGFYDVSKKRALQQGDVLTVLTGSVCISALILCVPLLLSRLMPTVMEPTLFFVPRITWQGHLYIFLKSCIVLSSWAFAYVSVKYLPLSVVSPMQATRPMWTLIGAMLIFGERLNLWQWIGVVCALGSIFLFSLSEKKSTRHPQPNATSHTAHPNAALITSTAAPHADSPALSLHKYYICLALAILIGSASGLYDKYMMRHYDHNAVQVYYTIYQALMMLIIYACVRSNKVLKVPKVTKSNQSPTLSTLGTHKTFETFRTPRTSGTFRTPRTSGTFRTFGTFRTLETFSPLRSLGAIACISVFLVLSDYVYMLALSDPDSMIAIVSTIRRGGTVIPFLYGILILREPNPKRKIACLAGILLGLLCLTLSTLC